MTTEINPRIVDREPVCDSDCPQYPREMGELRCHADRRETAAGAPCVEALRRQRDEARREVCGQVASQIVAEGSGCGLPWLDERKREADGRGWHNLFALLLALSLTACGTLPTGIRLSTAQCLDLADERDGALLAGKILAGITPSLDTAL